MNTCILTCPIRNALRSELSWAHYAARVVLTQHYISDVLVGMYLAVACVYFSHAFFLKKGYNLR